MATDVGNAVGQAAGSAGGAAFACLAARGHRDGCSAFSGLFGVGGGTIIVPLLVLWLGYGQKEAAGTSLAAVQLMFAWQLAKKAGLR
jgi:hypothetical protein